MSNAPAHPFPAGSASHPGASNADVGRQAFHILQIGFVAPPIPAGVDKFFHVLTNWDQYLAPAVNNALGGHGPQFMQLVGIIEIIAGLGVALLPRVFSYVVA